jgi:hypothetical protein
MEGLDSDHEVPPVSPGARRVRLTIGCLFLIGIAAFLVWFVIANSERTEGGLRIFGHGSVLPAGAPAIVES